MSSSSTSRTRSGRSSDGPVDILGRARRDAGDDLVVGRVDDLGGASIGGVDELPTDELLLCLDLLEGIGHEGASWMVHRSAGRRPSIVARAGAPSRHARRAVRRRSPAVGRGSGQWTGWPVSATRSMRSAARTVPFVALHARRRPPRAASRSPSSARSWSTAPGSSPSCEVVGREPPSEPGLVDRVARCPPGPRTAAARSSASRGGSSSTTVLLPPCVMTRSTWGRIAGCGRTPSPAMLSWSAISSASGPLRDNHAVARLAEQVHEPRHQRHVRRSEACPG